MSIFGLIVVAIGFYLVYMLHKNKYNGLKTSIILLISLVLLFGGLYILTYNISFELIKRRVYGLILFIMGFWLTFMFPADTEHQPEDMAHFAILIGLIVLAGGIWLMFF